MALRTFTGFVEAAWRALFNGNPNIPQIPGFPPGAANTQNAPQIPNDWAFGNSAEVRFMNALNTDRVRALTVNPSNQVMVAEGLASAPRKPAVWEVVNNASISSQGFFLVNPGERYRVVSITWIHATQSSVAGTAYIEKTPSGTAVGSGTSLMSGTFNLHTIANNTATAATLSVTNTGDSDNQDLILNPGDQLSVVIAGTITSLAGVSCTVMLAPLGASVKNVTYYMNANADLVQGQNFFCANKPYIVSAVSMRWQTKSSTASVHLTVTNDTSTNAPGAGTSVLTDNTNVGPLVTQNANITYVGTVSSTAATVLVTNQNRLSIEFDGGTFAALTGLVVTVSLLETASDRMEISYFRDHTVGAADLTGIAAEVFFTADRDYQIIDASEVHKTAGTSGSAVTINLGVASGTTAPGSATVGQITSAFSIKSTAETPVYGTLGATNVLFLLKGQRLCTVPSGTFTTAVGTAITVTLSPR